mmetsp:Transcript_31977/g.82872  ORF Transcript_31977/g.82872 Transcript_31977/m.82872 type:complete len:260 (-) Transcript_31977:145-924(-)
MNMDRRRRTYLICSARAARITFKNCGSHADSFTARTPSTARVMCSIRTSAAFRARRSTRTQSFATCTDATSAADMITSPAVADTPIVASTIPTPPVSATSDCGSKHSIRKFSKHPTTSLATSARSFVGLALRRVLWYTSAVQVVTMPTPKRSAKSTRVAVAATPSAISDARRAATKKPASRPPSSMKSCVPVCRMSSFSRSGRMTVGTAPCNPDHRNPRTNSHLHMRHKTWNITGMRGRLKALQCSQAAIARGNTSAAE